MEQTDSGGFAAVILDYGAVLCHPPFPHEIARMSQALGVTPEKFPNLYSHSRDDYDRGDLTTNEYWARLARDAGVELSSETVEALAQLDRDMWSRPNDEMTSWLVSLRPAGYKTALLSNMQHDMIAHVRAKFPWLNDFDHQIFSSEVRVVKPDPAVYRVCLAKLGTVPRETIFIDDREENVAAARALGITAFRFGSVPDLRRDLASAGFRHAP
ncbi:MAG TPA: HAD family phosphatase [Candidatus Acidoferrum sp.]|nr:HAD family phosphatase [Candidatus Acidoferrum sp.]